MKKAFMRGVCALNLEAMGMFHTSEFVHSLLSRNHADSSPWCSHSQRLRPFLSLARYAVLFALLARLRAPAPPHCCKVIGSTFRPCRHKSGRLVGPRAVGKTRLCARVAA